MGKVLLVDDDAGFRHLLAGFLEKEFEVYEAGGVREASRILESASIDLVCSDYNMADGTGLDLLGFCREKKFNRPFILMSAEADSRIRWEAELYGAVFCEKTDMDLLSVIKNRLRRQEP